MFGVATSLGFGVLQVNAGFAHLFGMPVSTTVQVILIAVITGMATLSAGTGLDKGVKRLSELNIILAIALLIFVLFAGSTVFLLQAYVQNIGTYLGDVVQRTFRMYAYEPNAWLGDWTLFYWGWWISWSPFVGMFIARISRGRTIREFVTGVLLVPVLFTFLWMTVFGNTAIAIDLSGAAPIVQTVADNMPVALFEVLEQLPFSVIASGIATLLVITFFVTSADSGALVMDMITSGAAPNPPVWQRIFWAVCAGIVAAVLLLAGGLQALQTAALASALPFAVVMLFICYGLLRALQTEKQDAALDLSSVADQAQEGNTLSWQQRLASITGFYDKNEIMAFISDIGGPALKQVAAQFGESGLAPEVIHGEGQIVLSVPHGDRGVFRYTIRARSFRSPSFAWAESGSEVPSSRHYRAMAHASEGSEQYDVTGYTGDQLINNLLKNYARFRHTRRIP
jgi:choline/glycine/proline betaine transport protein